MEFQILSHAGLLVKAAGATVVIDPWLTGSCYWRSWWNYPPVTEQLVSGLRPDFIYLTHIHWDHFHGVSLRRFARQTPILVPEGPSPRMARDLARLGFLDVRALRHAVPVEIAPGFRLTSYQFGLFLDSAIVLESDGVVLLNANDAKFMGGPLRQILRRHPRIDFVFRSHSSANSRLSYEIVDAPAVPVDDLNRYIDSFAAFARASGARYAIPFASNHCYLHRDVFPLNRTIQTPRMVAEHFRDHRIERPEVRIMLSSDRWSSETGFHVDPSTMAYFDDRTERLDRYREEKRETLEKFYATEARARTTVGEMQRYFKRFRATLPSPIRLLFRGHPIRYVLSHGEERQTFEVDLHRGGVREIDPSEPAPIEPFEIHTTAFIMRQCMALDLFSHLAISKRVRYRVTRGGRRRFAFLNLLFNCYEMDCLPLSRMFSRRFLATWIRRWREPLLYFRIALEHAAGWRFSETRHILRARRS